MINPLERQIVLSLAILRVLRNNRLSLDEQGKRIQKINARRMQLLQEIGAKESPPNLADSVRYALVQSLGTFAATRIHREI